MHSPKSILIISIVGALIFAHASFGQSYYGVPEHQKLQDHSAVFQESFASSVGTSGEWCLAFEASNQTGNSSLGTIFAHKRRRDGWSQMQEIVRPPGTDPVSWQSLFGNNIRVYGDMACATNTLSHDHEGSIATIELLQGTWSVTEETQSPRPNDSELFGHALDISSNRMIVGAVASGLRRAGGGVVYFYDRINGSWEFQQAEFGNDPFTYPIAPVSLGAAPAWQFYDWYAVGTHVAIHGDVAAVSYKVLTSEEIPLSQGKVFVFERINGTWTQTQILKDPNSGHDNQFGFHAVEIGDDQILVGDAHTSGWGACFSTPDPGEIFVFQRSAPGPGNWDLIQTFEGSNASVHGIGGCTASDGFGEAMSADGNRLLVGAPRGKRNPMHNDIFGEAYLFERSTNGYWSEIQHYRHSDWDHRDNGSAVPGFGGSVSLSENYAVVGHRLAFGEGDTRAAGAAYVFELPHGTAYCVAPGNSTGEMATLTATGNLDPTAGILTLWGEDLPSGSVGLLLASPNQGLTIQPGASLGDLCLAGPLARVSVQVVDTDGRARFATDPLNIPIRPTASILSGETWYFQAYYRDQWAGASSNFTQATAVPFP